MVETQVQLMVGDRAWVHLDTHPQQTYVGEADKQTHSLGRPSGKPARTIFNAAAATRHVANVFQWKTATVDLVVGSPRCAGGHISREVRDHLGKGCTAAPDQLNPHMVLPGYSNKHTHWWLATTCPRLVGVQRAITGNRNLGVA